MSINIQNENEFVEKATNGSDILLNIEDDEMALSEHIEEFSQRTIFSFINLVLFTFVCFFDIKDIVKIFQAPALRQIQW